MKATFHLPIATALLVLAAMQATPALAQRVFVAGQGSDGNPCSFAAPCRTFQRAHDAVASGGEIDVLDPAGYGALNITKAISIQGHGFSGISVGSGGVGITINAGTNDRVHLNGLLIEGGWVGLVGILFSSGKSLVIENCLVRRLTGVGLGYSPAAPTPQTLSVSSSYFVENGYGMIIEPFGTGVVTAAIDHSAFYANLSAGLFANGSAGQAPITVAVSDSDAANSDGGIGYRVETAAGQAAASLLLTRSGATGNGTGILSSGPNATVRLAQSVVTGNAIGYNATGGGAVLSYVSNTIDANGTNLGTLGFVSAR
jgi:hypothetical protein